MFKKFLFLNILLKKRTNNNVKEINHLIKIIFIAAFYSSCFLSGTVYSITRSATFERITTKDGLSSSGVTCIIQDKKGFMWFATYGGLNKYDGHMFKVYRNKTAMNVTQLDIKKVISNVVGTCKFQIKEANSNLWRTENVKFY